MNYVEPIKDKEIVRNIINYLKKQNERDMILFLIGIFTGLRISDILKLQVQDVKDKRELDIRDKKTKKSNRLEINPELYEALNKYIKDKEVEEYLFRSRKGKNVPITRGQAYKILRKVAKEFNIKHMGTHTLRKTFGYHLYMITKDITQVQKALNHSSPADTLRYIGLEQEKINDSIRKLKY